MRCPSSLSVSQNRVLSLRVQLCKCGSYHGWCPAHHPFQYGGLQRRVKPLKQRTKSILIRGMKGSIYIIPKKKRDVAILKQNWKDEDFFAFQFLGECRIQF